MASTDLSHCCTWYFSLNIAVLCHEVSEMWAFAYQKGMGVVMNIYFDVGG